MVEVLNFREVTVLRGGRPIVDRLDWLVTEDQRWVVLGPNGAGKTTILQLAGAQIHPTSGRVEILGEVLGAVDVFELRPRIGLASAALAERIPADERVRDVVVTAAYGRHGSLARGLRGARPRPRRRTSSAQVGADTLSDRHFGTLSRGGAQAGADRPGADDRPRAAAARRARRRARPRRPRGPRRAAWRAIAADRRAPAMVLVTHHVEEIPAGFTHVLLLRDGRVVASGPIDEVLTGGT